MRLHLLGLPHTITTPHWSHCAFTGKLLRFSPMMRSVGYEVLHYGVAGAESGASEQVDVMAYEEWLRLGGEPPESGRFVENTDPDGPLQRQYNANLRAALEARVRPDDMLCLQFGRGQYQATDAFPWWQKIEVGIGYEHTIARFRVFESYAWMHWLLGSVGQMRGDDYNWVIPNYFRVDDWPLGTGAGKYLLYFGRLTESKGLSIVKTIAEARPDLLVVMCGLGDPTPWMGPKNLHYMEPIHGSQAARADLLGNALAVLMPSRYVEPFGSVAAEALLCGTPVLTSPFGAFTEIVTPGYNGERCRTLDEWLAAVADVEADHFAPRQVIQHSARGRYDMQSLAHRYDKVFRQINDLWGEGWYTRREEVQRA